MHSHKERDEEKRARYIKVSLSGTGEVSKNLNFSLYIDLALRECGASWSNMENPEEKNSGRKQKRLRRI